MKSFSSSMGLKKSFARHNHVRTVLTLRAMSRVSVNVKMTFNSALYMNIIAYLRLTTTGNRPGGPWAPGTLRPSAHVRINRVIGTLSFPCP